MQPKFHKIDQNTDEWFNLRKGKFTASSFKDLFASKSTQAYKKAIYKVAFERLTNESPESFSSDYMQRGHELEPLARMAYEKHTFAIVEEGGFWTLGDFIGASPDGLVGKDGILEIKCPAFNTTIDYLLKGKLPTVYKWQVYGQLMVTGRKWCDFVVYHPSLKLMIIRIVRDETIINELKEKIKQSIVEAETIISKIK